MKINGLMLIAALPFWSMAGEAIDPLPIPISNNATAVVNTAGGFRAYSFNGLLSGKTWKDVSDRAFEYDSALRRWMEIEPVPGGQGRLASTAQVVGGAIYLFGGYSVAEDGSEKSIPSVHRFDPETRQYRELAPMPVPVDDTVASTYRDRYIILVSGWHDTDNVDNVQVYDTRDDQWQQATAWPGPALFGHAGGISGDTLVICDGVKVVPMEPKREFHISAACFRGEIDAGDPSLIDWQAIPAHPGAPRYRMAACGIDETGEVMFAAGSTNPYNYDGIGYDGIPSDPASSVFSFDVNAGQWNARRSLPSASMDHRNLVRAGDRFLLIGGMGAKQTVLDSVRIYDPKSL